MRRMWMLPGSRENSIVWEDTTCADWKIKWKKTKEGLHSYMLLR